MKVSFANIVDLQILFYIDEFDVGRGDHVAASVYRYNFTQKVRVRNAALTAAGGAPGDLLNVPVAWYVEWRSAGSTWSPIPAGSGRFLYSVVESDWAYPMTLASSFQTTLADPGRSFRLKMIIDPDNEYLDSDRSNNQLSNTFDLPDD